MIGNKADARIALDKVRNNKRPRGWKTLGEGISRKAVLSPSGIVYKVESGGSEGANFTEAAAFNRYRRWKSLRYLDVYIPQSRLYGIGVEDVIAMEYIEKTHSTWCYSWLWSGATCNCKPLTHPGRMCYTDLMDRLESEAGMVDIHSDNLYRRDDQLFVIDLGYN